MNIWLLLSAIVILWAFAFSLMYLSLWLEEKRERQFVGRVVRRLAVGENVVRLDDYRNRGGR